MRHCDNTLTLSRLDDCKYEFAGARAASLLGKVDSGNIEVKFVQCRSMNGYWGPSATNLLMEKRKETLQYRFSPRNISSLCTKKIISCGYKMTAILIYR